MTLIIGGMLAHCALVSGVPLAPVDEQEEEEAWDDSRVTVQSIMQLQQSQLMTSAQPIAAALLKEGAGAPQEKGEKDASPSVPLSFWVGSKAHQWSTKRATICVRPRGLAPGALLRLWPGAEEPFRTDGIYVASPELQLLSAARRLQLHEFLALAGSFCGTYDLRPDLPVGFTRRDEPWTSPKSIGRVCAGTRSPRVGLLRETAPLIPCGCASPEETAIALFLTMPPALGGHELQDLEMNPEVTLSVAGSKLLGVDTAHPDAYFGVRRVDVEYDSQRYHENEEQAVRDNRRKAALEMSGIHVVPLMKNVLYDRKAMDDFVKTLSQELGQTFVQPPFAAQLLARRVLLGPHTFW